MAAASLEHLAELTVEGLDSVGGVDSSTYLGWECEERRQFIPALLQGWRDLRKTRAPLLVEGGQRLPRGLGAARSVDLVQIGADRPALLPRHESRAGADHVYVLRGTSSKGESLSESMRR